MQHGNITIFPNLSHVTVNSMFLLFCSSVCNVPYCRWDLSSHERVVHRGEKVMCDNCGSCFSKKSNLYNHLNRGKGCPRRLDPVNNREEGSVVLEKKILDRQETVSYTHLTLPTKA